MARRNLQELAGGTDPTRDDSYLVIYDLAKSPTRIVTVKSALARTYSLYGREDLYGTAWTMLTNNVPGTGGLLDIPDSHGLHQPVHPGRGSAALRTQKTAGP